MQKKVLASLFKSREDFDTVAPFLENPSDIFDDVLSILYVVGKDYYEKDPDAECIDYDVLMSVLERKYNKHYDILSSMLSEIQETTALSSANLMSEFFESRKHVEGTRLAQALLEGRRTEELLETYYELCNRTSLESAEAEGSEEFRAVGLDALSDELSQENKIILYPEEVQARTGGAIRGDQILVVARPEIGKTLFVINLVRGFLDQALCVLYIGNEDPPKRMVSRIYSSMLGVPVTDILDEDKRENYEQMLGQMGHDRLIFVSQAGGTIKEIENLCKKHTPDVLVVDQIRNVDCGKDGLVATLESAAISTRNMAKKYNLLSVLVTQAGDSASGKACLTLSDIDSSKTGLPASQDLIIGIGSNKEYEARGKRMLSFSKNKLSGTHDMFTVGFNIQTNRVT